ncbi:MAG TPA: M56 family metallopeptidase [Fimbriimonas sp.]|nr:M56 family metallopeptidase [Fimbriimonas sp.]
MNLLLDLAAKSTVVVAIGLLGLVALRKGSAASRHAFLLICLASLLALPVLEVALPRWEVPWVWVRHVELQAAPEEALTQPDAVVQTAPAPGGPSLPAWALFWGLGSLCFAARVMFGLKAVAKERSRRPSMPEGPLRDQVQKLTAGKNLQLLIGSPGQPPMTWGWRQPVMMLPDTANQWPEDRLRSVVLHEMAHIERADWLTQTMARLCCALYWFHPGAWFLTRALEAESERAADDRVLTLGCLPEDYASHLLDVARAVRSGRSLAAMAMARKAPIRERLESVLADGQNRRPMGRAATVGLFSVGVVVTAAVAAAGPKIEKVIDPPAQPQPVQLTSVAAPAQDVARTEPRPEKRKGLARPVTVAVRTVHRRVELCSSVSSTAHAWHMATVTASTPAKPSIVEATKPLATLAMTPPENAEDVKLDIQTSKEVELALKHADVEIKKASAEAKTAMTNFKFSGVDVDSPTMNVQIPAMHFKRKEFNIDVPAIHVYVPAVHIHMPKTEYSFPRPPLAAPSLPMKDANPDPDASN